MQITRQDDSDVDLYARSALANNANAALFISVHSNSDTNSDNGTMTLFYPSASNSVYGITAERFAQIVQESMIKNVGYERQRRLEKAGPCSLKLNSNAGNYS